MDNQQKELARQHTRAVLALTTLTGPLEVLEPAVMPGSKFAQQMQKVMRWRDECAKATKTKRLSAGAKRELDAVCTNLAPYMQTEHLNHDARLRQWAALAWVGILYVLGVKCTCPEYGKSQAWVYLDMTAWTLGNMLMQMVPGCDVDGTALYMMLHGENWDAPELPKMQEAA